MFYLPFETEQEDFFIDSHIKKELKNSIQNVYGDELSEQVYNKIIEHAKIAIKNRPQILKQQDLKEAPIGLKMKLFICFM